MSTSASVFQMDTFGKLTGIRVHMDGNLAQLGVTLYRHYDHMTMSKVIEKGDCSGITENPDDIAFYGKPAQLTELQQGLNYVQFPDGTWWSDTAHERVMKPYLHIIQGTQFEPLRMALLRNKYIKDENYHVISVPFAVTDHLSLYGEVYQEPHKHPFVYMVAKRNKSSNIEDQPINAVVICAIDKANDKFLVTREFRYAVNKETIETPAGLIDPGESVEEAALRELAEETGYTNATVTKVLPPSYSSVGMTNERASVVFVDVVTSEQQEQELGDTERIKAFWVSRSEAEIILQSENVAGRTQLLLLQWLAGKTSESKKVSESRKGLLNENTSRPRKCDCSYESIVIR